MTRHRHDVDLRPVWAILTATATITCAITWAAWWVGINRITRPRPAAPAIQQRNNVSYIQRTQPLLRGNARRQAENAKKRKP